jgi:hypothetical protein
VLLLAVQGGSLAAFGSLVSFRPRGSRPLLGGVDAIGRLSRASLRVVVIDLVDE